MIEHVRAFHNQIEKALNHSSKQAIKTPEDDIFNVLVVGMGGSGIGADIVYSIIREELNVPYNIIKSYDIPNYVDSSTLVVCSSFSGNTEEVLSAYEQALDKGAEICIISSGGKLLNAASDNGHNVMKIESDIPSPRANLGYSVVALLYVLKGYGLISDSFELELENLAHLIKSNQSLIEEKAREMASDIKDKLLIMYGGDRIQPALLRNAQQINENGKQFCHFNVLPEMNHNEIIGWQFPKPILDNSIFVTFSTDFDHARTRKRIEICSSMLKDRGANIASMHAKGSSFLEQLFYFINVFDFVSCYLAEENNVDPVSIEAIDFLKSELAKF